MSTAAIFTDKTKFPSLLKASELPQNQRLSSLSSGILDFDRALSWGGIPKGELTWIHSPPGLGGTSFWLRLCAQAQKANSKHKLSAWVESPNYRLYPPQELSSLFMVKTIKDDKNLFWIFQELLESQLFDLIGYPFDENSLLSLGQMHKLKQLTRVFKTAFVFVSPRAPKTSFLSYLSLSLQFHPDGKIQVCKAKPALNPQFLNSNSFFQSPPLFASPSAKPLSLLPTQAGS